MTYGFINLSAAFETWTSHDATERRIALKWDQRFMEAFSESSPPGLDEILALEQIMGFMEEGKYDLYVLDTAPTGHLLELLQLPQLLRDWLRYAYRGLLKWHLQLPLTELTDLRELIFKSSKTVEKVRGIFTDPERSEFVAVTIPEAIIAGRPDAAEFWSRSVCRPTAPPNIVPDGLTWPIIERDFDEWVRKQ